MFKNLVFIFTVLLASAFNSSANAKDFDDNYPGLGTTDHIAHVATTDVIICVEQFYKVYGRFPLSWQEVRDKGLSDVDLIGFHMQPIDPDDPSLDFKSDLFLENNKGHLTLHWMGNQEEINHIIIQMPKTYSRLYELVEGSVSLDEKQTARIDEYINNEAKLRQLAVVGILNRGLQTYYDVYGEFPQNLNQFFNSGLSPITSNIPNPVTGTRFEFDGSPGDLQFHSGNGSAVFWPVDEKGVAVPEIRY